MSLNLPGPVARYFAAEESRDVEAQTQCFTGGALVHDEGRDYRGLRAISDWKQAVQTKFNYQCEPLSVAIDGNAVTVVVRLTGNFPGSPVELDHTFMLAGNKIGSLVIE